MAAGDVYRLTAMATQLNAVLMNNIAVQTLPATDPDATLRQALADDFKTIWRAQQYNNVNWTTWQLRQLWGDGMTVNESECIREGGVIYGAPFSAPTQGVNNTGEALPPQCAVVVTLSTGLIGRRKRGRMYGFGWGEQDQSAGTWTSTYLGILTTALNVFFAKYKQGGTSPAYQLGVWSERTATGCETTGSPPVHTHPDAPKPDQAFTPVTGFTVRSIVYNQRRRTLGVGR